MFGLRKWPTPFAKPLMPFFIATGITFYGVVKMQEMGVNTPEALANPKNPYAAGRKAHGAEAAH